MSKIAALSILGVTVALSVARPRIGRFRVQPPVAALLGAALMIAAGLASPASAYRVLRFLALPFLTIASLMIITQAAERAGAIASLGDRLLRAGRGDGRRLFLLLFVAGAITGALFTNDAAVLIFTPLALRLVEQGGGENWTSAQRLPFYFAALYVANLVGPFIISNPINLIIATRLRIGFLEYAAWMVLPAIAGAAVTYGGLRFYFRRQIPRTYSIPRERAPAPPSLFLWGSAAMLLLTLAAFAAESALPFPPAYVALGAAAATLLLHCGTARQSPAPVFRGVAWELFFFVFGVFVVAVGLKNAGLTRLIADEILAVGWSGGASETSPMLVTGLISATSSALMNNHPVAGIMTMVFDDLPLTPVGSRIIPMCALIGGDLGPKMLPIGSLAALLWFRKLRERGVRASYWEYVKLGVPVTLAAIVVSVLLLRLELWFFLRYLVAHG